MKNSIMLVLLAPLLAIMFFACHSNPTEPIKPSNDKGGILMKIDKTNAPANIMFVTAELSRPGFQSLVSDMNVLSDSSAEISFSDIPVGLWHLKVDAKDSINIVLYSGESDVNILPAIVTQVNLTLVPTGTGSGSIQIFVHWGTQQISQWLDYINNPVFLTSSGSSGFYRNPVLIVDASNNYKMWFANILSNGTANIGLAVSTDGYNWNLGSPTSVILPGNLWDSHFVVPGAVISKDSLYYMFYNGGNDNNTCHVGLAKSFDGKVWTKEALPVFSPLTFANETKVVVNSVVIVSEMFYMYYSSHKNGRSEICLATSSDGLSWTRHSANPILVPTANWESLGIYNPSAIKDGNIYRMVYMNVAQSSNSFGLAVSNDGINWEKESSNPFFDASKTYNLWAKNVQYPFLVKTSTDLRIYYTGVIPISNLEKIGLLRKY